MSRTAAPIRLRKLPSIQSRVNSSGTLSTRVSSSSSRPRTSPNHLAYVPSLSASLSRPEISSQRSSADSSTWCSTDSLILPRLRPAASITVASTGAKCLAVQGFSHCAPSLHSCGQRWGKLRFTAFLRRMRLWTSRWTTLVYTGRRTPPAAGIFLAKTSLFPAHEAHLPTKCPPPQAQARVPCTDVDESRPGDPEAPPRQGSRPPLRLVGSAGPSH